MKLSAAWLILLAGAGSATLNASTASHLFRLGAKAEQSGKIAQAYLYYTRAAAADPKKALYRQKAEALAPLAVLEAQVKPPDFDKPSADPEPVASAPQPSEVFDSITASELARQRQMLPPPTLELSPGNQDYELVGDRKNLFQVAALRLGLRVTFDPDFELGSVIKLHLKDVGPREILHDLEVATNSFIVPLGPHDMLVAQDNETKRRELEQVESIAIPIPTVTAPQDLTELGQAVKQSVGIEHVFWDAQANQIILRDRVSRVLAGQSVLNDLLYYRSQVAVDVQFIEISETQMIEIGADLQTSFPITFLGAALTGNKAAATAAATNAVSTITLSQLSKFSVGRLFGVGIVNADVVATLNRAKSSNLLNLTLVTVEGQKASFHAGEKYPIITSQYVGAVNTGGQVFSPTPSFTFEDLGVVLNLTTHVHTGGEVSMEVDTEYKVLGATQQNGLPIVSNRKLTTTVRLKQSQWALVAGLTQDRVTRSVSGPAFFSYIPFLGHLISHFSKSTSRSYVLMAIKPRIISTPPELRVTHEFSVGSETKTVTPI